MVILCPTRGRPAAAREALASFMQTRQLDSTQLVFALDDDDPALPSYLAIEEDGYQTIQQPAPGDMVKALNSAAEWALGLDPDYLGFIGDDHRFRTPGWDLNFRSLLTDRGGGMVYGNDLNRVDGDIPTQIVMSAEIVRALGWFGLPTCTHLYIDNAWRVVGEALEAIFYMPDIVIEHLHPAYGKAAWDEGHRRVNTSAMYDHDAAAFSEWIATTATDDVLRVKEAMGR